MPWKPPVRRRRRRGANAVEFALTLPVFMTIYLGIMEIGWFFYQESLIADATRDGCREGGLYEEEGDDGDAAEQADLAINANLVAYGIDCSDDGNYSGACDIQIDYINDSPQRSLDCVVSIQYAPIIGYLPVFPEDNRTESIILLERQ